MDYKQSLMQTTHNDVVHLSDPAFSTMYQLVPMHCQNVSFAAQSLDVHVAF